MSSQIYFFFFNDTATTEIYTLSLHDALPICSLRSATDCSACSACCRVSYGPRRCRSAHPSRGSTVWCLRQKNHGPCSDRKSTRLNSSHANISYAVFCLKKKINLPHITFHPNL